MRPLGKFLIHAHVVFAFLKRRINFKTSLPVAFTSIARREIQGIGMETFCWAGWWDEAKKSHGGGKQDGQNLL